MTDIFDHITTWEGVTPMSKKLTLGMSPLTRIIYAGSLLKCGKVWAANQTDVTQEFIALIKEYVGVNNEMTVTSGGTPQFLVRVLEPGYVPVDVRDLTQQRDELLAALKEIANVRPQLMTNSDGHEVLVFPADFNPNRLAKIALMGRT